MPVAIPIALPQRARLQLQRYGHTDSEIDAMTPEAGFRTLREHGSAWAWALSYAWRGWHVFPVKPGGKTPATGHGFQDATQDSTQIASWWHTSDVLNLGVACGASGLVVVDVDNHDGAPGLTTWAELCQRLALDTRTPTATTPSGGVHIYFAAKGHDVRNSAGKLGAGLDVRAQGGYVVAPPSVASGKPYTWAPGLSPDDVELLPLPDVLAVLLQKPPQPPQPPQRQGKTPAPSGDVSSAYGEKALREEVARVRAAMPGTRNDTLNAAAYALGRLVSPGLLDAERVASELESAGLDAGLEPEEIAKSLKSGLAAGLSNPREPKPRRRRTTQAPAPGNGTGLATTTPGQASVKAGWLYTDIGNGQRLAHHHGGDLRYCKGLGGWLAWDSRRWLADDTRAQRCAKATAERIIDERRDGMTDDELRQVTRWWLTSQSAQRVQAQLTMGQSEPVFASEASDYDANPWLLNCENGVLDLQTGQLRAHRRSDMCTKLAAVAYDERSSDDKVNRFLRDITGGDSDFLSYLQRAVGYSLTGDTGEEALFLVLGTAGTGKSTFVESLLGLLGDYGAKSSFETFLRRREVTGGARPEIVALRGARFVAAVEVDAGRRLDASLVKELVGGDTITARSLYVPEVSYKPQLHLWLACNESPTLSDDDAGLWRRLRRVPFERVPAKPDASLKRYLTTNASARSALLAWAVAGCFDWQAHGLGDCDIVTQRTSQLRASFDPVAEFFATRCVFDAKAETPAGKLRAEYELWAMDTGARALSNRAWSERLKARGCTSARVRQLATGQLTTGQVTVWRGIGLLP